MRRRKHHGNEQTRNTRTFVIRIARRDGMRTSIDFTTSDKRRAYRQARQHAAAGRLLAFLHHSGRGNWQDLTAEILGEGTS